MKRFIFGLALAAAALVFLNPGLAQTIPGGGGGGGSGVPSIAGTANQITETGSPGATTLSLPSNIIPPGTVNGNTVPSASDTFTLNAATQTLTNKSISGSQINSGTIPAAQLPLGSTSAFGAVKCDGTSITCTAGVITATTGGSGTVTSITAGAVSRAVQSPAAGQSQPLGRSTLRLVRAIRLSLAMQPSW